MFLMKIIACTVVKNEADIIKLTLLKALEWADYIIVLDNKSTDGTNEIIINLSLKEPRIIYWGVYGGAFRDSLRSIIFNDYKHLSNPGDWWCRLDSDEIYIDNPKAFLTNVNEDIDHIYSASFQYYITESDIIDCNSKSFFHPDELKYYKCDWSEIRFYRVNNDTIWPLHFAEPLFLTKPSSQRIKLKHYQYRTLEQMAKRFNDRSPQKGKNLFSHELHKNKVWDKNELKYDNGIYNYNERDLPKIKRRSFLNRLSVLFFKKIILWFGLRRVFLPSEESVKRN